MAKSKRITFLASLTKGYNTVIDIGSDHGLVLKQAFDLGYIKNGISTDIKKGPLKQAEKNLKGYPIKLIQSDGFLSVNEQFDLAIIAGMGAHTIMDILDNAPNNNSEFILQANDKIEILRNYLVNNNFKIVDEYVIFDKFFYVILKVVRGQMNLTEKDIWIGPILKTKTESKEYYQFRLNQISKIYEHTNIETKEKLEKIIAFFSNAAI